jgi:hypothetical protein
VGRQASYVAYNQSMRIRRLVLPGLFGAAVGGCNAPTDHWVHEGDSGYYYNYVQVPSAPQMDSLVPGDRRIAVHFTGSNARNYIAVCTPGTNYALSRNGYTSRSPALVDSLQNDLEYDCSVTAFNDSRPSKSSGHLKATPKAP